MSPLTEGAIARPFAAPSFREFVLIVALMMGLVSLSIDNLLPAFDAIQAEYRVVDANDLQLMITAYMAGFGLLQIVYGPISDVIGRRTTLMIGLVVYVVGALMALLSPSYETLLVARVVQGMGAAAARVLSIAIIRDRYAGREMARVMSLTLMIFILVPIVAPTIGSALLLVGGWRLIFASMFALAGIVAVWFGLRMPETLHPEYRKPFSLAVVAAGLRRTVTTRVSIGYSTAMGVMMGCLMTYIASAQAIFADSVYHLGTLFPIVFACIAAAMGTASFLNSRFVRRLGMRRLSHAGICGFAVMSGVMLLTAWIYHGVPPLLLFAVELALVHFLFSLTVPNFNALAMEPLGEIAGTGSSFIGSYTTLMGALLGWFVGNYFDGTVIPLGVGYFGLSLVCLGVVVWTEKGQLFVPHRAAA